MSYVDVDFGKCDVCGKETKLNRLYVRFENIICECHSPCHFELLRVCDECIRERKVRKPYTTKIIMRTDILEKLMIEKHAKWKCTDGPDASGNYQYNCSNCGQKSIHGPHTEVPYCWYCGAKMDEKE